VAWLNGKKMYQILWNLGVNHLIEFSEDGGNLSHPVSTVVKKEKSVAL
jgi:hypothetical protein